MFAEDKISFRKLQFADLPQMAEWLQTDFVKEWWHDPAPTTVEALTEEYGPVIEGTDSTQAFFICYDSTPIGYIQTYRFRDNPEWQEAIQPEGEAAGVDIFIGDTNFIHRGLGTLAMKKFLKEVVFSQPDINNCYIDPEPANKTAIRSYEKAGFTYWKTLPAGIIEDEPEGYWLRLSRADFLAGNH